jgi:polysaccharide deacetylase 2 family uncharacterized protein YibQ
MENLARNNKFKKNIYLGVNIVLLCLVVFFILHFVFLKSSVKENSLIVSLNKEQQNNSSEVEKLQENILALKQILGQVEQVAVEGSDPADDSDKIATTSSKTGPVVAIIINNLGLSKSTTEDSFTLPAEVTLSFSPYSTNIDEYVGAAKKNGHEIMINLPLEPKNYPYDDPGNMGLISSLSQEENLTRLEQVLNRTKEKIGIFTSPNEKFSQSETAIIPIINKLKSMNLLVVFSGDNNKVIEKVAKSQNFPLYYTDLKIDENINAEAIDKQLELIEKFAKEYGGVIATGSPYPITINKIEEWIYTLEKKNIHLVPISAITSGLK